LGGAKTFDWTHLFHRSLYDLFRQRPGHEQETVYRKLSGELPGKARSDHAATASITTGPLGLSGVEVVRDRFRTFQLPNLGVPLAAGAVYDFDSGKPQRAPW